MVNGATGGVGSFLVQLLLRRGATVVATGAVGAEETHIRKLGAEHVVDWRAGEVGPAVRLRYPQGVNALIDLISADAASLARLADAVLGPTGGRVVSTLEAVGPDGLPPHRAINLVAEADTDALATICALAAEGSLSASIGSTYAFDQLDQAFEALRDGAVGKVAVRMA